MSRIFRTLGITAIFVLSMASTGAAGMIAVTTFDEVPSEFQAGTSYELDYSIMMHGEEPAEFESTALLFHGPDGETLSFAAESIGLGRWTAEVTLPRAGEWRWEVTVGTQVLRQLGTLDVGPATPVAVNPSLLAYLRVGLPVASVLAIALLIGQIPRTRPERHPAPVGNVV